MSFVAGFVVVSPHVVIVFRASGRGARRCAARRDTTQEENAFGADAYDVEAEANRNQVTYTVTMAEVAQFQFKLVESVAEVLGAPFDTTYLLLEHFG